jgi:hypothetical protein
MGRRGGMEVVKEKEGIEFRHLMVAECALQMDARTFDRRFALPYLFYRPFHGSIPPSLR